MRSWILVLACVATAASAAAHLGPHGALEIRAEPTGDPTSPYRFEPQEMNVYVGANVRWTSASDLPHRVVSVESLRNHTPDGRLEGPLPPGDAWEHRFEEPGTYVYVCAFHPETMWGVVTVLAGLPSAPLFFGIGLAALVAIAARPRGPGL